MGVLVGRLSQWEYLHAFIAPALRSSAELTPPPLPPRTDLHGQGGRQLVLPGQALHCQGASQGGEGDMSRCAREERETCIKGRMHAWNPVTMLFLALYICPVYMFRA